MLSVSSFFMRSVYQTFKFERRVAKIRIEEEGNNMSKVISVELLQEMEKSGFSIVTEGKLKIPNGEGLVVTLADCRAAGAKEYRVPRNVDALVGGRNNRKRGSIYVGEQLFLVFDTVISYKGKAGQLSWLFGTHYAGMTYDTEKSTGIGPFTTK
jgi:hypothetical protein